MRLVIHPLFERLDFYGLFDEHGGLVGVGDRETCESLLSSLRRPPVLSVSEADGFCRERLREAFERWLSM